MTTKEQHSRPKNGRTYKMADGTDVPLFEAPTDFDIQCYRTDRRKAVMGDPLRCIIAMGGLRHPQVREMYVGSGKDAYVVIEQHNGRLIAFHYVISASARHVLDAFDNNAGVKSQRVTLRAPTSGLTLAHRRVSNKRRRQEVANGAVVKPRPRRKARITRIEIKHRPRAPIAVKKLAS